MDLTADENACGVRVAIDAMSRVAEEHGALLVFVHHARKPKADDPEGARYKIRGSSALFDACGSVFVFSGEKGAPTRVTHEKCRNRGTTIGDFGLRIEDVDIGGMPRHGLEVVHLEPEQLVDAAAASGSPYSAAMDRISQFLLSQGGVSGREDGRARAIGHEPQQVLRCVR